MIKAAKGERKAPRRRWSPAAKKEKRAAGTAALGSGRHNDGTTRRTYGRYNVLQSGLCCLRAALIYATICVRQSVLELFQDAAGRHADMLGSGYEDMKAAGKAWVLMRVCYHIRQNAGFRKPGNGKHMAKAGQAGF